jgi:isopentenyl diphosphate isomerase/L-lactate dehydrogenase-like FMN-dependent dehydrogenase
LRLFVKHARALEDCGLYGEVQLIIAGGIRDGVDAAKALASAPMRLHRHRQH